MPENFGRLAVMKLLVAALLLFGAFVSLGFSQATIDQHKRDLIHQFAELTRSNDVDLNITYSADGLKEKLTEMVDKNARLTETRKAGLRSEADEILKRIGLKWKDVFETDPEFKQLGVEAAYDVYAKAFTEDELKELIGFYSSPVGKKSVAFFASVKEEVERSYIERARPRMESIIAKLIASETESFAKHISDAERTSQ